MTNGILKLNVFYMFFFYLCFRRSDFLVKLRELGGLLLVEGCDRLSKRLVSFNCTIHTFNQAQKVLNLATGVA